MTDIVIIAQNEGEYVERMIESINPSWFVVYVADRCTDETIVKLDAIRKRRRNIMVIDTSGMELKGRQTSSCRNLGLKFTDQTHDVLFLDGDRYSVGGSYEDAIRDAKTDTLCFPLEIDMRDQEAFDKSYGCVNSCFYSCGLWMRRDAINRVIKWQGSLFNTELQSEWGVEDTFLGDVCYHLNLTSALTDKCVLRGSLTRNTISKTARLKRFMLREPLNVKWH